LKNGHDKTEILHGTTLLLINKGEKLIANFFPFEKLQQSEIRRMIVSYPHETRRQNDLSISSYLCKFQPTHCLQIREFYGQENKH